MRKHLTAHEQKRNTNYDKKKTKETDTINHELETETLTHFNSI